MIKTKRYLFAIFIFFLLSASFYWFEIRPAKIRSSCWERILEGAKLGAGGGSANLSYRICLVEHGMKPENLFDEN